MNENDGTLIYLKKDSKTSFVSYKMG